ncbi:AfsR/SARP family transcriptional regulator [Virgisporangium aliadipatigenens]|uniref:AfsR/SARP family transcriptional regulator n=1 Tax=Virgisporangium aliadipatigenens TaxID=741659 RepID=UPI0019429BB5|nr:BTAD domain-containing putative transcriptional regulator [Virgisporangium aliadipatigenens]
MTVIGTGRLRMLGTLEYRDGDAWAPVPPGQPRTVLAVLMIEAGRTVSADRLVDEIWGERPPRAARNAVQGYVMRLRRLLGDGYALLSRDRGYAIDLADDDLDASVFAREVEMARRRLLDGDLRRGAGMLADALALWRGPALCDVPAGPTVTAESARLEEARLVAVEAHLGARLDLGQHAEITTELRRLVDAHPLREELRAKLMLALYRGGRRADALAAYREGRELLDRDLGLEPGPRLTGLELAILRDAPELAGPERDAGPIVVPAQLPSPVAGFTGRADQLARLDALLPPAALVPSADPPPVALSPTRTASPGGTGSAGGLTPGGAASGVLASGRDGVTVVKAPEPGLTIATVVGTAGVGKSALAAQWAHRVRALFPDGQLHVNLRGYAAGPPLPPLEALHQFLSALGVAADRLPVDLDEAAGLFRSLTAGRRMLLLLDNACEPAQVRPLLPGGAGSMVLVTSRDELGGLIARDGAVRLALSTLTPQEGRALVAGLLPAERTADAAAVDQLVALCGGLPLALRIAAANLDLQPRHTIADHVAELRGDRLGALAVAGDPQVAVRAAFDLSYGALPLGARQLFRLLGLVPGPDIGVAAAAALARTTVAGARSLLGELSRAHLVEEHAPGRYAMHDLLRHYAAARAADELTEAGRRVALAGFFDHHLGTVDAAAARLYPDKLRLPRPTPAEGTTRPTPPETGSRAVADDGSVRPAGGAIAFDDHRRAREWLDTERPNLLAILHHAADHGPPQVGWWLADALRGYFDTSMRLVDWRAAALAGLRCAEADDDVRARVAMRLSAAALHWKRARYTQALDEYAAAASASRAADWADGESAAVGNAGVVYQELGYLERAAESYTRALTINERTGWRPGRANGLNNLGEVLRGLGRLDEATACCAEALEIFRATGSRIGEAGAVTALAAIHRDAGRLPEALRLAREAAVLAGEVFDQRQQADALNTLASIECLLDHFADALRHHRAALELAREFDSPYTEAQSLVGLALAHHGAGESTPAVDVGEEALAAARRAGSVVLESDALAALATVHRGRGDTRAAVASARAALTGYREAGHPLGTARASDLLRELAERATAARGSAGA